MQAVKAAIAANKPELPAELQKVLHKGKAWCRIDKEL